MKEILLIGSPHGDELLGDQLYRHITKKYPELLSRLDFIIGNPRAKAKGVRFIESDLNRSFNDKNETYEEKRARILLRKMTAGQYNLVLDLHTTTCIQPPCLIVSSTDHQFIRAVNIANVVHMKHKIVRTSLIGVCEAAISIEIQKDDVSDSILEELCQAMQRFLAREESSCPKQVFEVTELLRKTEVTEDEAVQLHNFQESNAGFYPILVGENSYKKHTEYLGFKARAPYQIEYNRR